MKILIIIGAVILFLLFLAGLFLYDVFGAPGIVIPLFVLGLLTYVICRIGLKNIFIALLAIVAIVTLKKILTAILEARREKRISFYRSSCFDEPMGHLYEPKVSRYHAVEERPEPKQKSSQSNGSGTYRRDMAYRRTNNCPNCGALMMNVICPYCETRLSQ